MAFVSVCSINAAKPVSYLFAYFKDNSTGQQVYFAVSDNGIDFIPLNEGKPVISPDTVSTQGGVRDPHIMRGNDGWYYMVLTDMDMSKGKWSNHGIVMLRSRNLVDWANHTVDFHERYAGKKFAEINAVWAPQTIWDEKAGKYMVYFSLHSEKSGPFARDAVYYAYANADFSDLEGDPQPLFTFPTPTIDTDIVRSDDGLYHVFFNTWGGKEGLGLRHYVAADLHSQATWTLQPGKVQPHNVAAEGSCVYPLHTGGWMLVYDRFRDGMCEFCFSDNLSSFKLLKQTPTKGAFTPRHGTVMQIDEKEKKALVERFGLSSLQE